MDDLIKFFYGQGRLKHYIKGENIYMPGDTLREVLIIKRGAVKIYDIDEAGNERTVSIFGEHHFIPIVWLLRQEEDVLFFYKTLCATECYSVPYARVLDYIKDRPDLLMTLLELVTKGYLNHDARIFSLQRTNVQERLEFTLYYLAIRLGKIDKKIATIPFALTQHEIANLAGASRESVSRELAKIASTGRVRVSGGKTYINLNKLKTEKFHKVYGV